MLDLRNRLDLEGSFAYRGVRLSDLGQAALRLVQHSLQFMIFALVILTAFPSLAAPVTVNLFDASTGQPIPHTKVTAHILDATGDVSWYGRLETSETGQAQFELADSENGAMYVFSAKVFNGFRAYSDPVGSASEVNFTVGKVRVAVRNGSVAGEPPLADTGISIKRLDDGGKWRWFSSATTDAQGMIRVDLPNMAGGQQYQFSAKSTVSGQRKYSEPVSADGDYQFVVGNKPLNVSLVDGLSGAALPGYRVDVYRMLPDGDKQWYSRGETDAAGGLALDLEGLGSGERYKLRAKVFNEVSSYSPEIGQTGDYRFAVGTTALTVVDGTQSQSPPLAGHKVNFYEQLAGGETKSIGGMYADTAGVIRVNLPGLGEGRQYVARAKSVGDSGRYYYHDLAAPGAQTFTVGKIPLTVSLVDAGTSAGLAGVRVTAYRVLDDGKLDWFTRQDTDANGQVRFQLPETESGVRYVLKAKPYSDYTIYSDPVGAQNEYRFVAGKVRVQVLNGTEDGNPAMANTKATIKKVMADGSLEWFASAWTDAAGMLRVSLPGFDAGQQYQIGVDSPASGQRKYSNPIGADGDHTFVVGNRPLNVTLLDGISGERLTGQRVDVFRLDEAGEKHWSARTETDAAGQVVFDLDNLGGGTQYLLRAKVFNDMSSYSAPINTNGDFSFRVGTTRLEVVQGSTSPATPLANHKVVFYELIGEDDKQWFAGTYTDANGVVRIDLPGLGSGRNYMVRAKSPVDGSTYYSQTVAANAVTQLVVGSTPLTVTLRDAMTGEVLPGKEMAAYRLNDDGSTDRVAKRTSDGVGVAVFDLPGLGSTTQYRLSVRGFDDFKSWSDALTQAGDFDFKVGHMRIQLLNGSVEGMPPLAHTDMSVSRLEGDKYKWFASASSDANGVIRMDLPGVGEGASYRFKSKSTVNGAGKYSEPVTQNGDMTFVVGNPAVTVSLTNVLDGSVYANARVTAYQMDPAGELHWYSRHDTDANGQASFDLDNINAGQAYIFKASQFSTGSSYSDVVSSSGPVNFAIGAVPVTLLDQDSGSAFVDTKVVAYRILDDGRLDWTKSGRTDANGQLTYDLPGLGEGARYVLQAKDPYGEGKKYYGPIFTSIGALNMLLRKGEYGDVDLVAPEVTIDSPNADIANAGGFTVSGTASDDQGVGYVEMSVGSQTVVAVYNPDNLQWQAYVPAEWLTAEQDTTITVTAVDRALNQGTTSRTYRITEDVTPPTIQISSHQEGQQVNVAGFTVLGTVSDDVGVASIHATVTDPVLGETIVNQPLNISSVDGQWALPVTNGSVSVDLQVTIQLLATDMSGRTANQTLMVATAAVSTSPMQLAQRITFGLTPDLLARVRGGQNILDEQLAADAIDDSEFEAAMAARSVTNRDELKTYLLDYMAGSRKQLREVMAWFWENHFNTNLNTHGRVSWELRENNLFREHALGRFRDLLEASAKSPAMIHYLNNQQNVAGRANENYAREIMELHTMGVDGGYTAQDIAELSRIFTGWHENNGEFAFNDGLHDDGNKLFLGNNIAGSGVNEGEQVLDILSAHSSTASYICGKLVTLFVSDQPVGTLQAQCAAEFLATDGNISAVLAVIFSSEAFAASENYRAKVKSPLELMVGTARGFNATMNGDEAAGSLREMGMSLFEFPVPTGFSEVAEDWVNSNAIMLRLSLVNRVAHGNSSVMSVNLRQLLEQSGNRSAQAVVSYLFDLAMAGEFTELEYQLALNILNQDQPFDLQAPDADTKLNRLLGTVLSFPGYQYN